MQPNQVFIGCPGSTFEHSLSELGGVRVITHFKRKVQPEDVGAGETPMLNRTRADSTSNNSEVELVSKGLV